MNLSSKERDMTAASLSALPVPAALAQHVDETISLYVIREAALRRSAMTLDGLRRLDDRLAAHLDGVWIAARKGWQVGEVGESPEPGSIFMATINAVEGRDEAGLAALIDHSQAHVDARRALVAACGWMEKATLQGVVVHLLRDRAAFARMLGIAACAVHRVDPGLMTAGYLRDPAVPPRARALRAAGELGHAELLPACVAALDEDDPEIAFWAAWSAVLLGNRGRAVRARV